MKTRKVTLLSSAFFLSMGLQAKRESANYSIGPETFAPLAGDANSSNYAQFSAVEPLSGLSVKDLPDFKNFTGFIGQLPALDQDGDGISDVNEVALGTDKTDPDTDGDGLTDGEEVALGTDPLSADSDGDGYSDFAEVDANTNPSVAGSNPNRAPSLIELNGSTVLENQPLETLVGHFSATDPDANQSLTLSIVPGVGNASLFFLDGNNGLRTASIFDYEASPNTLILSVRATDDYNASIDQTFVIEVANIVEDLDGDGIEDADDVDRDGDGFSDADELAYGSDPSDENSVANQAPVSISLSKNYILENLPPGSLIGVISVSDPDQNDSFQVSIVPPSDANGTQPPFLVEANGNLKARPSFDFETRSNYPLRLRASDQHGASIESDFVIQVLDRINEIPPPPPVDSNGTAPPPPTDSNQSTIIDHNDTHQPVPGPIDQNQSTEEPLDPVVDQNETDPIDHNQSIEPEQPDLAPPSLAGLKFRYNETELTNGQPVNYGWSEGRFNQEEFVEWDEDEQTLSHTPYSYAKINRKAAYFILSEEGGGEITVNLVFDSNRSGNGTWTETDGEEDFYGTLEFEISPIGAEGEPVQPPVDHNETQQPGPGPVDQNGTDVPPIYPPVDLNDSISKPGPDQNETIEPELPPIRLAEVITMTVVAEKSGVVRAVGRVASDGGEAPSKFGFAVSDQILFDENDQNIRYYEGEGFGFIFEVAISDLEAGTTHYIRSFAENSAGIIFGSVKRIKLETEYVAPFDALEVANGWFRSPWLGMFKKANSNWVFHPELGWIYHGDDHSNGTWVWIESFGWSWSRGDLWPYLWVSSKSDWVYYLGIHGGIPTFWDYTDQSIIRW